LRFTTKFDNVAPLLTLPHAGRTRVRISVNANEIAARFEGGTARLPQRIAALRSLALAGYRIGLTIAPIMPIPQWRDGYRALLGDVATALADIDGVDLTVECITHRFTAASKEVLLGWYPRTKLDMDEASRTRKFGKFGSAKYVYPKGTMSQMRSWFETELTTTLPSARTLYWT
jgi:spore photoproduct lyase